MFAHWLQLFVESCSGGKIVVLASETYLSGYLFGIYLSLNRARTGRNPISVNEIQEDIWSHLYVECKQIPQHSLQIHVGPNWWRPGCDVGLPLGARACVCFFVWTYILEIAEQSFNKY